MRKISFARLMAGTALVAATAISTDALAQQRFAQQQQRHTIENAIPIPPAANVPPPSRRDLAPVILRRPATSANAQATHADNPPISVVRDGATSTPPAPPAPVQAQPQVQAPIQVQAPAPEVTAPIVDNRSVIEKLFTASDAEISGKLREFVPKNGLERRVERAADRPAIEKTYAARQYAPIWIKDGSLTPRAKAVMARLKNAEADGFDPNDYPVPEFSTFTSAEQLAEGDIRLTTSIVTYARHLSNGRIAPTRVTAEAEYGVAPADAADILRRTVDASDVNAALDQFNPPHEGFKLLRAKLAEVRAKLGNDNGRLPEGAPIKPGQKDARIPALREKFGTPTPPKAADATLLDAALFNAVKAAQARYDMTPNGVIDNKLIARLNGPKASQQLDAVLGSIERWRWLPRDLGRTYVMINVPDFTLKVVKENNLVWRTKIVAGKPQTPTPLLTATMDNVVVNPSWYVPQSIIQNELLPLYATDPKVFERMGLEVKRGPDGNINVVQPPGAANALGHIKFNFPNKYQVYLHDTPEKKLFAREQRAFSHGCMRVENPTKFGEVMLSLAIPGSTPSSEQIASMYGKDEKTFKLVTKPMVHLTYQTAYVDDAGKLVIRDDIYGFDSRIKSILHGDERKIADQAPPQDPKRDLATLRSNQEILRRVERREANNPFAVFERIFR